MCLFVCLVVDCLFALYLIVWEVAFVFLFPCLLRLFALLMLRLLVCVCDVSCVRLFAYLWLFVYVNCVLRLVCVFDCSYVCLRVCLCYLVCILLVCLIVCVFVRLLVCMLHCFLI